MHKKCQPAVYRGSLTDVKMDQLNLQASIISEARCLSGKSTWLQCGKSQVRISLGPRQENSHSSPSSEWVPMVGESLRWKSRGLGTAFQMSLVIRKPYICICENKDADQLRSIREADQRLCFRYTDSTIPLLPKFEISSL